MASGVYGQIFNRKTRTLNWLRRERIRRRQFAGAAMRRWWLGAAARAAALPPAAQARLRYCVGGLSREGAAARQHARCLNSGRAHFVSRRLGLARMPLRQYARLGKLPNVIRRTWSWVGSRGVGSALL